jgi:predicted RNA-binding Zn ribbon-like protein
MVGVVLLSAPRDRCGQFHQALGVAEEFFLVPRLYISRARQPPGSGVTAARINHASGCVICLSAADMLRSIVGGESVPTIRVCANRPHRRRPAGRSAPLHRAPLPSVDCGWLYLDHNGLRQWCTMALCAPPADATHALCG